MFELIEIELSRVVRRMAKQQQADDAFLLYLIDMAILEANAKARANESRITTPAVWPLGYDDEGSHQDLVAEFAVVR